MKRIVALGRQEAVDAIAGTTTVMYKHGVWNSYYKRPTSEVVPIIQNTRSCGYGADVYVDEAGEKYVSIPCDSDMW